VKVFEYAFQVLENHLDTFGHVNNATYLQLYETARWDFITANGFGLERIRRELRGPVILEANVKFKRELVNREVITILSQSREVVNSKIMTIHQEMRRADGKAASEALFTVGFMDLKERKLVAPPEDWLAACGYVEPK
jgi:YbgC/YbaW family acyl-CoA thioester hydrolase